jgi:predicted HTH transcriptional regulator
MRQQMLDHGLDQPLYGTDTGYFQVTFPGPGDNVERLRAPKSAALVTPAIEAQLSKRQKEILTEVLKSGSVTSGWCAKTFDVVYDTAQRDLKSLVKLGLLKSEGKGRSLKYVLVGASPS